MVDNLSHIFLGDLDQDLESIGILLQSEEQVTGSMEFSDYFTNLQRSQHTKHDDSGDVTPISERSKIEVLGKHNIPIVTNSSSYCDITVIDDTDSTINDEVLQDNHTDMSKMTDKTDASDVFLEGCITPTSSDLSIIKNSYKQVLGSGRSIKLDNLTQCDSSSSTISENTVISTKQMKLLEKGTRGNTHYLGSDKWCTSKEIFLDMTKAKDFCKQNACAKLGAVIVKECYIEPPKISRVSKSLDGKSQASQSLLNIAAIPRRASDGIPLTSKTTNVQSDNLRCDNRCLTSEDCTCEKTTCSCKRPPFVTHMSHPGDSKSLSSRARFTTTVVNEIQLLTKITPKLSQERGSTVEDIALSSTNPNNA